MPSTSSPPTFLKGTTAATVLSSSASPVRFTARSRCTGYGTRCVGTQHSPALIDYLAQGIRRDPQWWRRQLESELRVSEIGAWASESHEIAIKYAYLDGGIAGVNAMKLAADPTLAIPAVPPGYLDTGEKVAMRRIATAGYRIADLLNGIFH